MTDADDARREVAGLMQRWLTEGREPLALLDAMAKAVTDVTAASNRRTAH